MSPLHQDDWTEELSAKELDALRIAAEALLRLRWGNRTRIHSVEVALRSALLKIDRLLFVVDQAVARCPHDPANGS